MRNDYWPDYNEVNQLNQRINDVESELALVNANLSSDIENVSINLNTYVNEQANTLVTNNIVVNNINANYALGKYANFANTNTDNAYIENLTVNKPVFDITLNTPHLENTTSLNGNFYSPNLIDAKFSGDTSANFNIVNVNTANISNLFVNTQPTPISSSAVLGYDVDGRVIPIHATFDAGFPENANYLFTDRAGTAFAGVAATEVGTTDNLITAYAVKNVIDEVYANVSSSFNNVYNSLNNIDAWQNAFENDVYNNFNEVYNAFNDVANNFNDVANTFNDVNTFVNDGFNNVYNYISNINTNVDLNDINNNFANIDSNFNNSDNNFANMANNFNDIYSMLSMIFSASTSNAKYWSVNNMSYWNSDQNFHFINQSLRTIRFETPANTAGWNISLGASPVYIDYNTNNGTELIFSSDLPIFNTDSGMLRVFNTNMAETFYNCVNFNQSILIPNGVTNMSQTFYHCSNLNQSFLIPNSVTDMYRTFYDCSNLNQNILIPNSVTNMAMTFTFCANLNQNIFISNGITDMNQTFRGCSKLNQNILIPNSVTDMYQTFYGCTNLNQSILVPNSVTNVYGTFKDCRPFNQDDVYIYSQNITNFKNTFGNVNRIGNIHLPTSVPKSTSNYMYNSLVNGLTQYTFAPENIINDLPVDIAQWPPV
jgi:hypothetical protein